MNLKSKFRIDTILALSFVGLFILFLPILAFFLGKQKSNVIPFSDPSIYLLLIFMGLLWVLCFCLFIIPIIKKTVEVSVNFPLKTIGFYYPFLNKNLAYTFEEIEGFRFSSFHSRICEFKTIVLKTKSLTKHTISEIQLSNFEDFENAYLQCFELRKGKDFEKLTSAERIVELQQNRIFEITQAQTYRGNCYFHIGSILFILAANQFIFPADRKIGWGIYLVGLIFIIYLLSKIKNANFTIKKIS